MKKVILSAISFAAFTMATSAFAADLPARIYTKAPAAAASFNWTGFYLGANVGFAGDETRYPISAGGLGVDLSITSSGFIGGGQIGYNWQAGNIVYGLETDFQGSGVESKLGVSLGGLGALSFGTTVDYFGTVRGRIGMTAWDRALIYATGGFAYGKTKTEFDILGLGVPSLSNDKAGWTVGAGLEYMLAPKWSIKTEYLYVDLGKDNFDLAALGAPPGVSIGEDTRMHVVRAGVNYHF